MYLNRWVGKRLKDINQSDFLRPSISKNKVLPDHIFYNTKVSKNPLIQELMYGIGKFFSTK